MTILFGNMLWESLDLFIEQVSSEIFRVNHPDINYGYVLIAVSVLLHLIAGLFIGLYAGRLLKKINYFKNIIPSFIENKPGEEIQLKEKRKKRNWF